MARKKAKTTRKTAKKSKRMRTAFIRISAVNHTESGEVVIYTQEDILNKIDEWSKHKKFEYYIIEHNEEGNLHWHIVIVFSDNSTCEFTTIKNKFPYGHIDTCRKGVKNCVRYITHVDKPEKTQYSWDDIITNAPDKLELYKIPGKFKIDTKVKVIVDKIVAGEIREYEINKIEHEVYVKRCSEIKRAFEYRRRLLLTDPTRNVTVIVLQGKTRLGKSTYCKVWAKNHDESIFFSSSGNDFFGEYLGQDIAVLDDFNHEDVKINDFKRMIDPHLNGAVASRYHNKLFIGDTIFIATNQPIASWFPFDNERDRDAVFERISFVLDFKSYDELTISTDLSLLDDSKIPKFSEKTSYYTVNKLVPTDFYKDVYNKRGYLENSYREWSLQPIDEVIHEFDLKKYIDITADETKKEGFLKQLTEI